MVETASMANSPDVIRLISRSGYFDVRGNRNVYPASYKSQRIATVSQSSDDRTWPPHGFTFSRHRHWPPPPSVEDEATSLAREYCPSPPSKEESPSKGDIDQQPIIVEVHAYNPERRFVIVNEHSKDTAPPESAANRPQRNISSIPDDSTRPKADAGSRYGPAHAEEQSPTVSVKPGLESRRNKQDLPSLETQNLPHGPRKHHRSRSTAATEGSCTEHLSRPYALSDNQLLSPDFIYGGTCGREQRYCAQGRPYAANEKLSSNRNRIERDGEYVPRSNHQRRRTASMTRRLDSSPDVTKPPTRLSGDWKAESRYTDEPSLSPRGVTRDDSRKSRASRQSDLDPARARLSHTPGTQSRASSESSPYSYSRIPPKAAPCLPR